MSAGRHVAVLILPSLLVACESRRASENPGADGTPASQATVGRDTPAAAAADAVPEGPSAPGVEGAVDSVVRIGVLDGDDTQVFGRIREVAVDDAANVYVLDEQAKKLSWFDPEGTFRGAAGGAGGGPGEFRAPTAIAVDADGLIQVLDMAHRRVSTFAAADSTINLVEEFSVPFFGSDFCRLDGRYFFLSAQDNGLIHEVTMDGTVLRSFGESPVEIPDELSAPYNAQLLRDYAARGRLVCVTDPPVLVFVPEMMSGVQAFDPDGALLWSAPIADYRQRRWELSPRGGVRAAADPVTGSAHTAMDASLVGRDLIAITLHEGSSADRAGSLELRLISLTDGSERARRTATGMIAGIQHGREYRYVNDPFPQITIAPLAAQR